MFKCQWAMSAHSSNALQTSFQCLLWMSKTSASVCSSWLLPPMGTSTTWCLAPWVVCVSLASSAPTWCNLAVNIVPFPLCLYFFLPSFTPVTALGRKQYSDPNSAQAYTAYVQCQEYDHLRTMPWPLSDHGHFLTGPQCPWRRWTSRFWPSKTRTAVTS